MKKYKPQENGITLIALIVTIVVLIMLAGVTISLLVGNNGIIDRAVEAKEQTQIAQEKEILEMILAEYAIENNDLNITLKDFINSKVEDKKLEKVTQNIENELLVQVKEYIFKIYINEEKIDQEYVKSAQEKVSDEIAISKEKLLGYFDYNQYSQGELIWKNNVKGSNNIKFEGTPTLTKDGIIINMKNKSVYGTLDISNRQSDNLTIYMIAKTIEKNSDNARFFEIPKYPTGNQGYTTPAMYVNVSSENINYGAFYNNCDTTVNAFKYNTVAMTINSQTKTINTYIDGIKYGNISFDGFGDLVYLAQCTGGSSGYGNNNYKMFAIYDGINSEEDIFNNLQILKDKYLTQKPIQVNLKKDLAGYFDYRNYENGSKIWQNSSNNTYSNMTIEGNATLNSEAITLDRKNNNTYGSIPIDNNKTLITIYMVAKANEKNTDNARFFEIPKYPTGNQGYTTPSMYVNVGSENINYGAFYNNCATTINAFNYNAVAMTINSETKTINTYIDGVKYGNIAFDGFGDILYLSQCTYNTSGYGNNSYKMFGIEYSIDSDEQIYANLDWLKSEYLNQ